MGSAAENAAAASVKGNRENAERAIKGMQNEPSAQICYFKEKIKIRGVLAEGPVRYCLSRYSIL